MPIISSPPGANTTLSNLASVAINISLISDTDSTDDLGSATKYWANAYIDKVLFFSTTHYLTYLSSSGYTFLDIWGFDGGIRLSSGNIFGVRVSTSIDGFHIQGGGTYPTLKGIDGGIDDDLAMNTGIDFIPLTDSSSELGHLDLYWLATYTDKLFLNSTATIDGATAGHLLFTGDLVPATDDTEWVGQLETPFKAIKGLIVKDTTNGKHYKVTVVSGVLTTTALD